MTIFEGRKLALLIRGASHSPRIEFELLGLNGGDGFKTDERKLALFMERRAPGRDKLSTSRKESDVVHFTGPGSGYILNENVRPGDYGEERTVPRPGHADWPQYVRFGRIPTGGGANSGRMTAAYCAAGGLCLQYFERRGVSVAAKIVKCGDIERAKKAGDSVGGVIECEIRGVPVGLGGAMFDGLDGELSRAVFGIPGVKGVEFGNGFAAAELKGSENNDAFIVKNGEVRTRTNNHGGILGGYSSGMPIVFRVAMKPTPTIFSEQDSVDLRTMKPAKLAMKGRHDPCIVRRAVPVVEAVAALVIADAILADEAVRPRICLTLTGRTLEEDLAQYRSQRLFTDMVELRVDLLDATNRARAAEFPAMLRKCGGSAHAVPVILTFRRKSDGGAFEGGEKTRIAFFRKALSAGGFAYVDFEEDFRVPALARIARKAGVRVIRSLHDFNGPVPRLADRLRSMTDGGDEIAKIAFMPKNLTDVSRLFKGGRDATGSSRPRCVIAMGAMGVATRVLAGRLGAPWTYASVGGLDGLGHVTPEELVRDYRFRTASRGATLFGVTGWPLKKTRSPELHNAAFAADDEDAVMIPFPAKTAREAIAFMKALEMRGLAVTIPHKETIMPLLDTVDPVAMAVGAVNTVRRDDDGTLHGFNTDVEGFTRALVEFAAVPLKGKRVALLGDGGAAKACRHALKKLGCRVETFHRRPLTAGHDVIVNATPVDPIPEYRFRGDELVYDLRYLPETTELMERAERAGCRVCNGFSMLRYQAAAQRRIWQSN